MLQIRAPTPRRRRHCGLSRWLAPTPPQGQDEGGRASLKRSKNGSFSDSYRRDIFRHIGRVAEIGCMNKLRPVPGRLLQSPLKQRADWKFSSRE
jgi:hypothetical protein